MLLLLLMLLSFLKALGSITWKYHSITKPTMVSAFLTQRLMIVQSMLIMVNIWEMEKIGHVYMLKAFTPTIYVIEKNDCAKVIN